jgi:hypothetical protein
MKPNEAARDVVLLLKTIQGIVPALDKLFYRLFRKLAGRAATIRRLTAENKRLQEANVSLDGTLVLHSGVASDCIQFLETAGYGKPGTANTLWGMTQAACEEVTGLRQRVAELEKQLERLKPYEKAAEIDDQRRERQRQRDAEIAAGLRCGGGILGCKGGPGCTLDHK